MIGLAWRNVARSWGHHGPVAWFFGLALALVLMGQGFLSSAEATLAASYPGAVTGDLLVRTTSQPRWNLFGSAEALWSDSTLAPPLNSDGLLAELALRPEVLAATPVITGPAVVDQAGTHHPVWVIGIDPKAVGAVLPGLVVPSKWTTGAVASPALAHELGDPAELSLLYSSGQDAQAVRASWVGVAQTPSPVAALDHTLWLDAPSALHLFGRDHQDAPLTIAGGEADLLGAGDDQLFGDAPSTAAPSPRRVDTASTPSGSSFVLVRLQPGHNPAVVAQAWSFAWARDHRGLEAVGWREAAGGSALYVVWLQAVLAVGVGLLALVGLGSLVNAMTGIVVERTAEVGTLRALGASRSRVVTLFVAEAWLVAGGACLAGVAVAGLATIALGWAQVQVPNAVFAALVGSHGLKLHWSWTTALADGAGVLALAAGATLAPLTGRLGRRVATALERVPE